MAFRREIKNMVKVYYQVGMSNPNWDFRYRAKAPGKRKTQWGTVYYEYRRNRSDMPLTKF